MCSICGGNIPKELVLKASKTMRHRGPDSNGIFSDNFVSLAHNRLSIIDISDEAAQPMIDDELVLIYNGEIYNYIEIKAELQKRGVAFRTSSDSETLLKAYKYWGVACLERLNGDFAFCVYNVKTQELFLARDRLGNKPLYYKIENNKIFFASEIKAFKEIFELTFDKQTLFDAILFNINDYSENTIYANIKHLPPAHYGVFNAKSGKLRLKRYWELAQNNANADKKFNHKEFEKTCDEFENKLFDAIKIRLRADVDIGVLLSGGIDSSLIAALLSTQKQKVNYFSAIFPSYPKSDESYYINLVANKLQINPIMLEPKLDDLKESMDDFLMTQSDMTRSFSTFVQYCVFKEISKRAKVAITGQGADELFGGYFHHAARFVAKNRKNLLDRIKVYGDLALQEFAYGVKTTLPKKLKKEIIISDNLKYLKKIHQIEPDYIPNYDLLLQKMSQSAQKALWLDTIKLNLPMLLRFEDRNAMRFGVENRTPFTDYRVVEFAHKIPICYKFHNGYGKFLLRSILAKYLGEEIAFRKDKKGFEAPDLAWMSEIGRPAHDIVDIRLFFYERLKALI